MSPTSAVFLVAAAVSAGMNLWAVSAQRRPVEYVSKPLTLCLLIGAALTVDPVDDSQRIWFIVALSFSLAGDIFLMLPSDRFLAGLTAFLAAHIAYSAGMVSRGLEAYALAIGAVVAVAAIVTLGRRISRCAPAALRVPVGMYMVVISGMVVLAVGTAQPWIAGGALLFWASDSLIGWTRFVGDFRQSRVAVMATYHLGQGALVLGLLQ